MFVIACGWTAPVLRHDWTWWPGGQGIRDLLEQTTSPWMPSGFGTLSPYQPNVILTAALLVTLPFGNASLSFVAYSALIMALCIFFVRASAQALQVSSIPLRLALSAIFIFNPWSYTEVVSGHVFMVFTVAVALFLFVRITTARPTLFQVTVLLALIIPQVQIFFVACAYVVVVAIARRRVGLLAAPLLCSMPLLIIGIGSYAALLQTVHALPWVRIQSVELTKGVFLLGYFAAYTKSLDSIFLASMCIFWLGIAAVILFDRWSRAKCAVVLASVAVVFIASGLKGPLAAPLAIAFTRFPQMYIYRELYDLLGLTLIGCLALYAFAVRTRRLAEITAGMCACIMIACWVIQPPRAFWVSISRVPHVDLSAPAHTRFALIPGFQPLDYAKLGSGLDPDAFGRGQDVYPVNETVPDYPVQRALSSYQNDGSVADLQALSVSRIVVRPYYESISNQVMSANGNMRSVRFLRRNIAPFPEMSVRSLPSIGTLDRSLAAGGVFFGDVTPELQPQLNAAALSGTYTREIAPPLDSVDRHSHWIDARLVFVNYPGLSQAFGGAYTESSANSLPVSGPYVLVRISGKLADVAGRRRIAPATRGFQWVRLPPNVQAVRCYGRCLVALQGEPPVRAPLEPPDAGRVRGIAFRRVLPWLLTAQAPGGGEMTLRYNERFAPGWSAYRGTKMLAHFRVDAIANGWLLPPSRSSFTIVIVERTAALEVLSYCALFVAICLMGSRDFARRRQRNA